MRDDIVTLSYFGAAAFKIITATSRRILIDPYITQNPLRQKDLEYFYDADFILVTHGAHDHLGDTVEIMKGSKAVLICGGEVAEYSVKMGIPKERIKLTVYGDQKELGGIRIKTVDARHISRIDTGTETYNGMPMGFIISTENGVRIYHAGDTALFGDLKLIGMLQRPNIFLVGISSVEDGLPVEMNAGEAALATLWVAPDIVSPMHYPPGSDEPSKFREAVRIVAPNVEPIIIEPNSQITYSKYQLNVG